MVCCGARHLECSSMAHLCQVVRTLQLESKSKLPWTPAQLDLAAEAEKLHRAGLRGQRLRLMVG